MRITAGTMTVGILAVIAGLIGAYAVRVSLTKEAPAAKPTLLAVPLASIDLPEGRSIALGDIGLVEMTKEELQARNYPMSQVMLNPDQIINRVIRSGIRQGEPFLTTALYLDGSGPDVSQMLRPGYRAATITIRDRNSVLPAQGNLVDVVFRSAPRDGKKGGLDIPEATVTLLQGVEVVSVKVPRAPINTARNNTLDLRRGPGADQPLPVVTVAVTGEQAEILKTVEGRGELSFVVRSAKEMVSAVGPRDQKLTLEELLGLQANQAFTTDIYRAGDRQTLKFQRGQIIEETYTGPPARRALPSLAPPAPTQSNNVSVALPAPGAVTGNQ